VEQGFSKGGFAGNQQTFPLSSAALGERLADKGMAEFQRTG